MTVTAFDLASYQHLLSEAHPRVPQTEAENEVLIQMVRELQDKGYLSPEEQALTAVLLALIEKFEDEHYSTSKAKPDEVLRELMRARDLRPKDLYGVFGSKGTTSEVLRGKRAISKAAAKSLAKIFNVKADLFL
jgi:antitoxin component HigA of HigAB toxin-antitoxin module